MKDKKILFLGLDAAMPDLVKKFVQEGSMPNTAKLMNQGIFSRLETVFPPLTAAAWTAIVSGAGSGTNGVPSLMVTSIPDGNWTSGIHPLTGMRFSARPSGMWPRRWERKLR